MIHLTLLPILLYGAVSQINHTAESIAPYKPLQLYQGAWDVTRSGAAAGAKPDRLVNQCELVGKFFACQQNVNGSVVALLIIIPAKEAGHYSTQNLTLEGQARGKGDLEITGDHWIFSSRWQEQPGKIVYYKTTNVFTGKNRIHFEQAESRDGQKWVTTGSGDDVRVASQNK